jgi:hypothetical protein
VAVSGLIVMLELMGSCPERSGEALIYTISTCKNSLNMFLDTDLNLYVRAWHSQEVISQWCVMHEDRDGTG